MTDVIHNRYDVNVHVHSADERPIQKKLDQILRALSVITAKEAAMAATIDDILAGVQAESTVDDSIIALLNNIAQQLANAGVPQAKIDAIMAVIQANQDKVTAAVTANTPAASTP